MNVVCPDWISLCSGNICLRPQFTLRIFIWQNNFAAAIVFTTSVKLYHPKAHPANSKDVPPQAAHLPPLLFPKLRDGWPSILNQIISRLELKAKIFDQPFANYSISRTLLLPLKLSGSWAFPSNGSLDMVHK
jgi:hypothetical protein